MALLGEVKNHAARLFASGEALQALRLCDAVLQVSPLDFEARLKVADCLVALDEKPAAADVYRAVAWYALKSGHPLTALVAARVLESIGAEQADIMAGLIAYYGRESGMLGAIAARINLPAPDTVVTAPDLAAPPHVEFLRNAIHRAVTCTDAFDEYPAALHPIPLLSELSEEAFRRVLGTLVVRRMPRDALVIREGEPGQSFFFVATGELRVFARGALGGEVELARLHESAVFGEMALIAAQPRSASVAVVSEADLLEVTRASLAALAGELAQVAAALHGFTRDRLLRNLMATNPLFQPFTRAQRLDLLRRFSSHDVAAGTPIIHEGEEGRGLFVVLSGEVEVTKRDAGGALMPLATLRAGDVFGEMSLVRGGPTTATVTAARPAIVLFLAREYVARMVAGVPEIKGYLEALADNRQLETRLLLDRGAGDGWGGEDERVLV